MYRKLLLVLIKDLNTALRGFAANCHRDLKLASVRQLVLEIVGRYT
jgi:hypothetical protein